MKKTSQEVVTISTEVSPIIEKANTLKIIDKTSMETATEFLSRLNIENDRLVEDREKLTKPINEALKGIRAKYKPTVDILDKAISLIRTKMGEYQMSLVRKQREEEAKITAKLSSGKIKVETAVKKIDNIEKVDEKVKTDSGNVSFMTIYEVEILSLKDIPLEYMIPDETAILKDLKTGKTIPGTKLLEKLVPKNSRGR